MNVSPTTLRIWHSNISAFIAPMVIFFALSGSLQIFDLHEAHGTYTPSAVLSAMGRLHKNQVIAAPPARRRPGAAAEEDDMGGSGPASPSGSSSGPPHGEPTTPLNTLFLKWLFLLEAVALATTTLIGVWIGVTHPKRARTIWILLGAGTLLPVALLLI